MLKKYLIIKILDDYHQMILKQSLTWIVPLLAKTDYTCLKNIFQIAGFIMIRLRMN